MTDYTKEEYEQAKQAYLMWSGNHPTIHCNRFANWEELGREERMKWLASVRHNITIGY